MTSDCICPTVTIRCLRGQVRDEQSRYFADLLNAQVETLLLDTPEGQAGMGATIWGKHRDDCPCKKESHAQPER